MDIKKNSATSTILQIVFFLIAMAALILYMQSSIQLLHKSGEISETGMIINGVIIALFLIGMFRILIVLFRYVAEYNAVLQLVEAFSVRPNNPLRDMSESSLIAQRYKSVKWVSDQGAPINQAAMAASVNASENSRLTVIRFVHSTLILAGVFGTVVSLSMALIGAAGLLNSPEGVKEMGTIISSMSSALSSTVTAIVCFFIFAYFYLRLNDARIQMLTSIEDVTSLHFLPKMVKSEEGVINQVTRLTAALNDAADKLLTVEQTFINAGTHLQNVIGDLDAHVKKNSLEDIKDLIRKGFHLSEPEYDLEEGELIPKVSDDINTKEEKSSIIKRTLGRL